MLAILTILLIVVYGILFVLLLKVAFNWLSTRYFPKYAVKLQLKKQAQRDKARRKSEQHQTAKEARLTAWANEHPDDPVAKGLLAQKATSSSLFGTRPVNTESEFASELRRRQESEDSWKRDREARELLNQRMLEWAINNSDTPEAHRHLEEQLEKEVRSLKYIEGDVHHCETMLSFHRDEDDPERLMLETNLAEAQAKRGAQQDLVRRIQAALEPQPIRNEQ